ncbi:hypothetical protein RvY_12855 [Ramazzottius varieornatus]|uniref:Uncharacterized protein n=1 Tax=Ramazzottius varieornatus TaxID=947166 RepID=A0A1D1VKX0_RAMVA|nr:hypothetical protein RvY_12855 [Ramazzottius varieornatus]
MDGMVYPPDGEAQDGEEEEDLPIDQDNVILNRPYQEEMIDKAMKENIICALGTGMGKMQVAVSIMKRLEYDFKPWNEGGKRTVFVVPSVPLVEQQVNYIRRWTSFPVEGYHGNCPGLSWTKEFWDQQLEDNCILVLIHDILLKLLLHSLLEVARINLLIFDECHHAVSDHPYREIMQIIQDRLAEQRPRIVGLTASIINCKIKKGEQVGTEMEGLIQKLESCLGAKVCTSIDESIKKHEAKPTLCLESFKENQAGGGEEEAVEGIRKYISWIDSAKSYMTALEKEAKQQKKNIAFTNSTDDKFRMNIARSLALIKSTFAQLLNSLRILGPWCGYQIACMIKKDFEMMLKNSCFSKEMTQPVMMAITELHMFGTLLEIHFRVHKVESRDVAGLLAVSSTKLQKLMEVLRANKPSEQEASMKCIVFVTTRYDAWVLHKFFEFLTLKRDNEFSHIKSGYLVGQLTDYGDAGQFPHRVELCYRQSQATIEKFRRGDINLLIATSVVEEGLNVPSCNFIVRFDRPMNYCSYLQSKGRARAQNSKYIVLTSDEDRAVTEKDLSAYIAMDDTLKKTCLERSIPDARKQKVHFDDKPHDSFRPSGSSAVVTLSSAMSLLQQYLKSMPTERSSLSATRGQFLDTEDTIGTGWFLYRIYMPLSSEVKHPVTGRLMKNRKLAKQSAALECCRLLYEAGAFDLNLLPKERQLLNDMEVIMGDHVKEMVPENEPLPGTKRRRQYYVKRSAAALRNCRPVPDRPLYLYVIRTIPSQQPQLNSASQFMSSESHFIGLLSASPIPQIPPFFVYVLKLEYRIEMAEVRDGLRLSASQIDAVQKFHCAVFEHVLRFSETIAVHFDPKVTDEALYTVPLTRSLDIDWALIDKVKDPAQYVVVSQPAENRKRMKIVAEKFLDGVVVRWYKMADERYLVLRIRADITPRMALKVDESMSYAEYFEKKYGIEIQHQDQPTLETCFCSRQLNTLRYPQAQKEEEEQLSKPRSEQRNRDHLMLVPELCQLFPISATLYVKALILPAVMHRLHWYCEVLDLRQRFREEIGVGCEVADPEGWQPLLYNFHKTPPIASVSSGQNSNAQCLVHVAGEAEPEPTEVDMDKAPNSLPPRGAAANPEVADVNAETIADYGGLVYATYERQRFYMMEKWKKQQRLANPETTLTMIPNGKAKRIKLSHYGPAAHLAEAPVVVDAEFHLDVKKVALPDPNQILNALTTAKASDGFNLERLEVIGDSFLKLSSYIHMFFRFPKRQEGYLTQLCDQQVSNYNLYRLAKERDLHHVVLNQAFEPLENFVPPGYYFDEEESNMLLANSGTKAEKFPSPRVYQALEDKTVADMIEAMTGVFLMHSSARSAQLFMSWMGLHVLPELASSQSKILADRFGYFTASDIPNPMLKDDPDAELVLTRLSAGFDDFEARIAYKFRNKAFLLQALTHSSYDPNDITDCYQRLKYLGDALIDFLVTRYVYDDVKIHKPGVMSDMRSALVNNRTLSHLAVKYNYHNHIKFRSMRLHNMIDAFVETVREENSEILRLEDDMLCTNCDDEEGQAEEAGFEESEAPKALGDVFEAVAGAIFLDSGLSLDVVFKVYYNMMRPQLEYVARHCPRNSVRELMESEGPNCRFGAVEPLGNGRCTMQVTILGKGTFKGRGNNARAAKSNAAKAALMHLNPRYPSVF